MAEVSGKFRFQATISSEYPAVGDFVLVNWNESGNSAIIESLFPRKSAFVRKAAGEPQQEQVVAANIDTVFLCMALNNDFNLRRLERYISIAWDSGATPVVVLTKSDLCDDLEQKLSEVSSVAFGVDVLVTTSTEENGYRELLPFISEGKTIAFIGSSGVGKSSLINLLSPEASMETGDISRKIERGRHTTRHSELFALDEDSYICDTPGFSSIYLPESMEKEELGRYFPEFREYEESCRFQGCAHIHEPDCAVKEALAEGRISPIRYENYTLLYNELKDKRRY